MADFANLVLGVDTRGLKKGERALDDTTRAGRKTERATDGAAAGMGRLGATSGGVAAAGMRKFAVAATAAVGALLGLGAGIRTIREFETSVSKLGAISGATTVELEAMRDVALELGSTTEFSSTQAADGLTFLAMAGFNASEAMASIPAVLDLATAASMGLAEAADTASNIMSGFGIEAQNASNVTDILAAASSRANTSVSQLGAAMSTVAPIASALDISLADTAASIGVLSDAGIQGERAGTALRGVLASLAGPTSQATDVLKSMGLTIKDIDPATNSLSDVMGKLGAAGLSTADAMTIFGREAASGALVLVDGARRLREFGNELANVDGAAKAMAGTIRDNLGGDIDGLLSALSGLMIALGDAGLTAALRAIVQSLTAVTRVVTDSIIPAFKALSLAMIGIAATQIPAMVAGFVALTAGVTATGVATAIFTTIVTAARVALITLGGPLGLVYGILGAGAAAWVLWGDNAKTGETAAYDAAAGTTELNAALRTFSQDVTPAAAASAIDIANANHELAKSAFDAARGELAKARAVATAGNALLDANPLTADGNSGYSIAMAENAATALARVEAAEHLLALAEGERKRAVTLVTGALSEQMTQTLETTAANSELAISLDANVSGLDSVAAAAGNLTPALDDAGDAAEDLGKAKAQILVSGIDSMAGAFGDFVSGGLKDFKGFALSIVDTFKNMLSQMIAMAVKNKIMISLGMGGAGAGAAAGAAGGGVMSGLLGGFGTAATAGSAAVAGTGFLGGLGGVGSGLMSGGLSGGAGALSTAFAGASSGAAGLAAAAGAAILPLAAVFAVVSFFKSKTKTIDEGIKGVISMEDAAFQSFQKIEKSRFFGLSKNRSTITKTLSAGAMDQAAFLVRESVVGAAESLGVSSSIFDGFTHSFSLSLKGLDEAAKSAAISQEFARMGESLANLVPHIDSVNQLFAVAQNRVALTDRLLQAQGKTEELTAIMRGREMDATNEHNKALLAQIFVAEDAAAAVNKLSEAMNTNENAFATGVDFRRGLSRAANNIAYSPEKSQAEMLAELKSLNARIDVLQSTSEITANSSSQTAENTDYTNALTLEAAT